MKVFFNTKSLSSCVRLLVAGAFALAPAPALLAAPLSLDRGQPPVKISPNNAALALQNAFIDVAASVSPAVVNISLEWTENVRGFGNMGEMDDFFNYWFYGPKGGQRHSPQMKRKQHSLGSGFLITSDGYILTNAHVIDKAEKITVTFEDGSTYSAKVIGKGDGVDIGVIKITDAKKKFPHLVLGDSGDIKVGEWAIAVGNPFGLDHTVTTGVISAKGRSVNISQESGPQDYIQTDASINPGNSGGPLCNIQGEVIGINSAIFSQSGGSVGIGFAIPANIARKAAEDLVNEGKVIRAGLGAVVQALSPQMAKSFGLSSTEGALLSSINPGSAAEKGGLKPGDIILAVDGSKVTNSSDLVSKLFTHRAGEKVMLTVLRSGSQSQMPVVLQALGEKSAKAGKKTLDGDNDDNGTPSQGDSLGLTFQEQTSDIKSQLPAGAPQGPVVTQVDPQSPAAQAGLQVGDVVLKVENTPILSAKQLSVVLKKSDLKNGVRLFVWRDGMTLYTFLQSGDE